MLERIQVLMRATFDSHSFPQFKDRGTQSERLQSAAFAMAHEFQNAYRSAQARGTEVNRQITDILVPYGDRSGPEQYAGVVREGKSKRQRCCGSGVLQDT